MESLYQLIHRSLTPEGMLPGDFSLPKPDGNQIHFADGAMDGITIFHTATGEVDTGLLEQAVWAANRDRMEEAQGLVLEFCETEPDHGDSPQGCGVKGRGGGLLRR